ncbi:MAG TPA: MATE family efflux transporter, partial [Chloroflexota bacterium]|nr:MATE family efflux transporter [Chloroflexota bacterium]
IVGHIGTASLAGLSLAGTLLDAALALSNFLTYATTAHTGRYHASGQERLLQAVAAQSLWLSVALGCALAAIGLLLGSPAVTLLGGGGQVAVLAGLYLRIGVLGLPFALVALAGQGYLRGKGDLRTPLVLVVGGNVLNVVLELLFVYGFGWGLAGSAWDTVIAQACMGAGFIAGLWRDSKGARRPQFLEMRPLLRTSSHILVRTSALYSSFVVASAVLARVGATSLAAHQVLFQLWIFLALVLDAIAIAGQVIVSRKLGAGLKEGAVSASRRMIGWSVLVGIVLAAVMLALSGVLPRLFTDDPAVLERVSAAWPIFASMQPLNGAVFALDGILIGAGDSRYLMLAMLLSSLVAVPLVLVALVAGWGIVGVWLALLVLIIVRLATMACRFALGRWIVTGVSV